ncbi:MAG: glycosyltransferase [Candidatus Rokubacteria bacterium]|nr:glycosyltransferase [Candidatus Rokubacteria bacterium]
MTRAERPLRILHVVYHMNPGGIETWLLHVLRHVARDRFRMDFLVHTPEKSWYEDEIRALGGGVLRCVRPIKLPRHLLQFSRVLRDSGPYDVVHSHVGYTGYILRLARYAAVPVRIAHSHSGAAYLRPSRAPLTNLFLRLTSAWVLRDATLGLAASDISARALFGEDWRKDPRWRVFYCGVDLAPFESAFSRAEVRGEFGLDPDAFVIGHVGRFYPVKNHRFLIDVVAEAAKREPSTRLLLVGDGPLRPDIERRIAAAGLHGRVVLAGLRGDVPRLMLGAMDAFVLPSLYEGLALALVEAQAAGLPCIAAESIPPEADVCAPLVMRLPLQASASRWAEVILATRQGSRPRPRQALEAVRRSPFNIREGVEELQRLYTGAVRSAASSSETPRTYSDNRGT